MRHLEMSMLDTAASRRYLRQLDLVLMDVLRKAHVAVIGVGGLGSFAALALAKMGVGKLTLVDGDTIEEHNTANQLYGPDQIGSLKVEACRNIIHSLTSGCQVHTWGFMLDKDNILDVPLIVTCVDSMEARQEIWRVVQQSSVVESLIDARAGAEELRFIYTPVSAHAQIGR